MFRKEFPGLPFIKFETFGIQETVVSRDGNIVVSSVSITHLLVYINTG